MGLSDKISDKVVKTVFKKETMRLSPEQLADIIKQEFIDGSDDEYLKSVHKVIKGSVILNRYIVSKSERYCLKVLSGYAFTGRAVFVEDREVNKFYQLDKDRHYKKLFKIVDSTIKMTRINNR